MSNEFPARILADLRAERACTALALEQMTAEPRLLSTGNGGCSDTTDECIRRARDTIPQLDRLIEAYRKAYEFA
ncbi:hypothetical protein [Dongia sp. agr-C8]